MLQQSSYIFGYSRMREIRVSVINFIFLRLVSRSWSSANEVELRIRLTGSMKGSRSLKQYVSKRNFKVSVGVE